MQGFNFGIRDSATPSVTDETRSRYIPSSIYSGPGPAEESPLPPYLQQQYSENGEHRRPSQASAYTPFERRYVAKPIQPRASPMLNTKDPVAMHLLMETAIMDSKDYAILSFEELEYIKRERAYLRTKVEGGRRQLALEKKMLEAAHTLNKLGPGDTNGDLKKRSGFFSRKSSSASNNVQEELHANAGKVEKLAYELQALETRLQDVERRILHHTAGILQFTHKGLKKNVRKNEFPQSPESMASQTRSISGIDGSSEFDERSLYQVPDYVHDFRQSAAARSSRRLTRDAQPIEDIAVRLHTINTQLHNMIQQVVLTEHFEPPPEPTDETLQGRVGAQIQAHLTYLTQGIEALGSAQQTSSRTDPSDSVEQITKLTSRLHGMLERTNSVSRSPILAEDPDGSKDLQSQLAYSATVLDRLNQRVDSLLEQKDILTRQIQQQRELNSKSDAQRDTHIRDLAEELEEAKKLQEMSEKEMQQTQDQMGILMEQLDQAKQNEHLLEQQRGMQDDTALEAERDARKEREARLMKEIEGHQYAFTELQADHAKIQNDFELKSQNHLQQLHAVHASKDQTHLELEQKTEELEALKKEMVEMESQVVQFQTELTMAKAELDGAYGSRAQRAADVSMNPGIKKQIDDLQARNDHLEQQLDELSQAHEMKGAGSAELQNKVNALQKELKDTLEDYEFMTTTSIDFERERDELEATIDELREKSEGLATQISEDQVRWIGIKDNHPPETTSTMVLKNEFKKMMRDSRAESLKSLKAEQDERKRLEGIIRGMRKQSNQGTPSKPQAQTISSPALNIRSLAIPSKDQSDGSKRPELVRFYTAMPGNDPSA